MQGGCVLQTAFTSPLLPNVPKQRLRTTGPTPQTFRTTSKVSARLVSDDSHSRGPVHLHNALLHVNERVVSSAAHVMDGLYGSNASPWRRLWLLEVVARVPYFSFLCVNHLAESLGLGSERVTHRLRAHFAEADNEAAHLAIMEELGGGERWADRFLARHIALVYFWANVLAYLVSPSLAYHFSELVERHAFLTYDKLLREREEELRYETPIPLMAHKYYSETVRDVRRIESMYDVIVAIRDDEASHADDLGRYSRESVGNVPWRGQGSQSRSERND